MTVISVLSAKSGVGVTTAALALALGWPTQRPVILAELDPLGGEIAAGYLGAAADQRRGLIELLASPAARSGDLGRDLPLHAQSLPESHAGWLRGLDGPAQAQGVPWAGLGEMLAQLPGVDVIADLGAVLPMDAQVRSGVDVSAVWLRSDIVLFAVRPTLPSVRLTASVLPVMRQLMTASGLGSDALGLLVTGPGPYSASEIGRQLEVPVVGVLPDSKAAGAVAWGMQIRGSVQRTDLIRKARDIASTVAEIAQQRRAMTTTGGGQ